MDNTANLTVNVHGNVRLAEFPLQSNICVRLSTVTLGNWNLISGDNIFLSCFSYRGADNSMFIDLPFEFSIQGESPHMCKHFCRVYCFLPESSSILQWMIEKIRSVEAEFVNPLMPATSDNRYVCQTSTKGYVEIEINVGAKEPAAGFQFNSHITELKKSSNVPTSIVELTGMRTIGMNNDNKPNQTGSFSS
uniref:Uncharacterized protein n=1 Tax=Caenorhabditis japonica TaxID=281687 RepID=A0A8R1HHM7_CAEJA